MPPLLLPAANENRASAREMLQQLKARLARKGPVMETSFHLAGVGRPHSLRPRAESSQYSPCSLTLFSAARSQASRLVSPVDVASRWAS